jgi:hypothetical protein
LNPHPIDWSIFMLRSLRVPTRNLLMHGPTVAAGRLDRVGLAIYENHGARRRATTGIAR